ncbi:IPIL1 protein, partial [Tricholaema leucomelas]|nr:IPIL1 protein [Tricholaema leucomelas]
VKQLMDNLVLLLQRQLLHSYILKLRPVIGVGSTFEGWGLRKKKDAYHLLLPLWPPRGYNFSLVLGETQAPAKYCRIHVELLCACRILKRLCNVHDPVQQERWRKVTEETVLDVLCTNSYLDVEKVVDWFQRLVKESWELLLESRRYKMKVLPSSRRSCQLQLTRDHWRPLYLKIIFGVQQGHTDLFFSSETAEDTSIPGTMWIETFSVAEMKFFSYIAMQFPYGNFHLRCLRICSHVLEDIDFPSYILKTGVMHLLNTTPASGWSRWDEFRRLSDILVFLHCCLKQKHLNHFFLGNRDVPKEIILPSHVQTSQPHNILQCLVQNPAAHAKALRWLEHL